MLNRTGALVLCAISFMAFGSGAVAAEFSGDISIGIANTDNVRLSPAPLEESETIYQLTPSFKFVHDSQRFDATVLYQLQAYKYSDLDTSSTYHQFDGNVTAVLLKDELFIDAGAVRSQSLRDPDGVLPSGNLPLSNNLVDRDELFISPRLAKNLGRSVSVDASYRLAETQYGGDGIQNNTTEQTDFAMQNYRQEQGLTWALRYNWEETDYDLSLPWEYRQASAELGFWVNGNLRVFGSGGEESAWDDLVDRSLADPFWEAGFAYGAGEKVSAEFAVGERSFGKSWRGNLNLVLRRGSLDFSYSETPTTNGQNRFRRGGLTDLDEPENLLDRAGDAERYISERLQLSWTLELRRTTLNVVAFDESRTGRFLADGTPQADESQSGIRGRVNWQLGTRTSLFARGSLLNRKTIGTQNEDIVRAGLGGSYQLGSNTRLTLDYDYSEQDPAVGTNGMNYVANVTSLSFIYSY